MSRRGFLASAGALGLSVALAGLPEALARRGWLDSAEAADPDLVRDTFNGLASFVVPGDDDYSRAQGVWTEQPGGVAAGTAAVLTATLDGLVPAPFVAGSTRLTIPVAASVATLLNVIALQVNLLPGRGPFLSPFARLSFREKAGVFQRFEADPLLADTEFRFVAGVLPGFAASLAFSEAGVLRDGKLAQTPVGWRLADYDGPAEGWPEFKGYYQGRRAARGAHRFVRPDRSRARRRRSPRRRSG